MPNINITLSQKEYEALDNALFLSKQNVLNLDTKDLIETVIKKINKSVYGF